MFRKLSVAAAGLALAAAAVGWYAYPRPAVPVTPPSAAAAHRFPQALPGPAAMRASKAKPTTMIT